MAIIYTNKFEEGLMALWNITEEEDELLTLADLTVEDHQTFTSFKAVQRRKEWLAIRALLKQLIGKPAQIEYFQDGRPFLKDSSYQISISHTKGYAAILLLNKQIPGLDIELETRSAEKVATRILSPEELEACRENGDYSNRKLLIHWCAKETIFKMVPDHAVSYLNHIRIYLKDPVAEPHPFAGTYISENSNLNFDLFYKSINDLIIIWGWENKEQNIF